MNNKALIFLFGVLLFLILIVVLIAVGGKGGGTNVQEKMKPVTLEYWRVWDGPETMETIIDAYSLRHPFVKINYRLIRYDEYEQKLLEAFASDRAPDIFSIHNTWTRKYEDRQWIAPMPAKTEMVHLVTKGSLKKEVVPELRATPSPSLNDIRDRFVDAVYDDIVISKKDQDSGNTSVGVYGVPLAVDTLIMLVNRDLLNNAGITKIPEYWDKEFQQTVRKLTKQDNKGNIIQSGASLGTGANIERSSDIVSMLMMQNGTEMMNLDNTIVTFHEVPKNFNSGNRKPGEDAIRFYTDFSNPAKEVYSWNTSMDNSLELFIQGKVAIMFGYTYMIPQIKAGNPKMNLVAAKIPQIPGNDPVNFANYWVEVVANKSDFKNEAWNFLLYSSSAENVVSYLEKVKKPAALRSLVEAQRNDLELAPYVDQVLTARSWYKGNNSNSAEKIIRDTIDAVVEGRLEMRDALEESASKVQQTVRETF